MNFDVFEDMSNQRNSWDTDEKKKTRSSSLVFTSVDTVYSLKYYGGYLIISERI